MSEDNNKAIDVDYEEIKAEVYYNSVQVAKMLNDNPSRVRSWADSFGDILNIEKVNGRKRYKQIDVENMRFIKELLDKQNFTQAQVKEYCREKGFAFAKYNSGLVNPDDPLGFQALAVALSVESKKQIEEIASKLSDNINEQLLKIEEFRALEIKKSNQELAELVEELVEERLKERLAELKDNIGAVVKEENKKLVEELKPSYISKEDIDKMRADTKKGLISKLFGR